MKVTKQGRTREIRDNQLERHLRNGWHKVEQEVKAVLTKPKKDTEDAPAVDTESEQGEYYDNKGED